MDIIIEYSVSRHDSRYNGNLDSPNFNDGVIKKEIITFNSASELWNELHKFGRWNGVSTSFGQYNKNETTIKYISHELNENSSNNKFETIVSE
jgi:hypothetical protein